MSYVFRQVCGRIEVHCGGQDVPQADNGANDDADSGANDDAGSDDSAHTNDKPMSSWHGGVLDVIS